MGVNTLKGWAISTGLETHRLRHKGLDTQRRKRPHVDNAYTWASTHL